MKYYLKIIIYTLLVSLFLFGTIQAETKQTYKDKYLKKALQAASWLESKIIKQTEGITWAPDPEKPDQIYHNLYAGSPGTILFFLETYYATGNSHYLDIARQASNHLITQIPKATEKEFNFGLYTGITGWSFVFEQMFKATGDKKYRSASFTILDMLVKHMNKGETPGREIVHDIISGDAGLGLYLLYMTKETNRRELIQYAARLGHALIKAAVRTKKGLKWQITKEYKYLMPNFSHGTAGVCYFLARLYQQTQEKKYLDAAMSGAGYLAAVANLENNGCLIFHYETGGEDRFYLGWCHGPPGTARLFYCLYTITNENRWLALVNAGAQAILNSGIPLKRTTGFWNNVGRCCGSAGVGEFMIDLQRIKLPNELKKQYLQLSIALTDDLLKRATTEGKGEAKGLKWIHAEHRKKPELLTAQTGLMQGAAGIGLWLLKLHGYKKGSMRKITFPDNPF